MVWVRKRTWENLHKGHTKGLASGRNWSCQISTTEGARWPIKLHTKGTQQGHAEWHCLRKLKESDGNKEMKNKQKRKYNYSDMEIRIQYFNQVIRTGHCFFFLQFVCGEFILPTQFLESESENLLVSKSMSQKFGFRIWQFMQSIFLDKCQLGGANKSRGDHCSAAAPQTHPQSNYLESKSAWTWSRLFRVLAEPHV